MGTLHMSAPVRIRPDWQEIWKWFVGLGAGLAGIGALATLNLMYATMLTSFSISAMMLLGGVLHIVHGVGAPLHRRRFFWLASGLFYVAAGFSVLMMPFLAASLLTLILAVALGLSGIMRMVPAWVRRPAGWGWTLASGSTSLAAAAVIASTWPGNSLWFLGLLLSVDLLIQGATLTLVGLSIRSLTR